MAKDNFGLDQSQVRLCHAITRHTVLVMAAQAICAVTAALLRSRSGQQASPPGQPPGQRMIPLTVPDVRRMLAAPNSLDLATRSHLALVRLDADPSRKSPVVPSARPARTRPGNQHEPAGQLTIKDL